MRFLIVVEATPAPEAGAMPGEELIAGYTIIEVRSPEEAVEWSQRFPNPAIGGANCEIEVRQLFDLGDFEPGPAIQRFRAMELPAQQPGRATP